MFFNRNSLNLSRWMTLAFGVMALLLGMVGILRPELVLLQLGLGAAERAGHHYTLVLFLASSVLSLIMGGYNILGAFNNLERYDPWTVPFRGLAFTVFTIGVLIHLAPARFMLVAARELVGAVAAGVAVYYQRQRLID